MRKRHWPQQTARVRVELERFVKLRASLNEEQLYRWASILESLIEAGDELNDAGPDADPQLQREWLEEADATLTVLCCESHMGELMNRRLQRMKQRIE